MEKVLTFDIHVLREMPLMLYFDLVPSSILKHSLGVFLPETHGFLSVGQG